MIIIGSGAIAQVHLGELKNHKVVAIKVLHPNIHDQLDADCKSCNFNFKYDFFRGLDRLDK